MINDSDKVEFEAGRVTIYVRSEFLGNIVRVEASSIKLAIGRYAQYERAIKLEFKPKGCRSLRGKTETFRPYLVVLEGWGHPAPADPFRPVSNDGKVQTSQSLYSSCDERWATDFDAVLDAHIAGGAKVLGDYRRHNAHGA